MGGCLSLFGNCCVFSKRHDNNHDKYSATSPLNKHTRIPLREMSTISKTANTTSGGTTHEWSESQMNEIRAFQKSVEAKQTGSLINLISKTNIYHNLLDDNFDRYEDQLREQTILPWKLSDFEICKVRDTLFY